MSNISEGAIKATAKLYHYRDTLKKLWGADFHNRIKSYSDRIQQIAFEKKQESLMVAMDIVKNNSDGMYQLIIWAAVTELMEPSEPYKEPSLEERLKGL